MLDIQEQYKVGQGEFKQNIIGNIYALQISRFDIQNRKDYNEINNNKILLLFNLGSVTARLM